MDEGRKRRLPTWMLGVTSADQVRKSGNQDPSNNNNLEKQTTSSKVGDVRKVKDKLLLEVKHSEAESSLFAKCETKIRVRKTREREVDGEGNGNDDVKTRSKKNRHDIIQRKRRESVPRKGREARISECTEITSLGKPLGSDDDDDDDLTMQDLMMIAEEYVKAGNDSEKQRMKNKKRETESQLAGTDVPKNESEPLHKASESTQSLTVHKAVTSSFVSTESSINKKVITNPIGTGDPAQDMLDLFLGPLLKKPLVEEKKKEYTMDDITFSYALESQSQNESVSVDDVPLMKKKSSLKDKVAMFFD